MEVRKERIGREGGRKEVRKREEEREEGEGVEWWHLSKQALLLEEWG